MSATHISGPLFIDGVEVTPAELVAELEPDDVTLEAAEGVVQVKAGGIDTAQLADGAVETDKIADEAVTEAKLDSGVTDLLDIIAAIPTADAEDSVTIWNDNGVLKVSSAGA